MRISLRTPVGDGHVNDPRDIADLQKSLITVGAISPDPGATRSPAVLTPEIDMAVSRYQADRGLKVDGQLNPGGPTERAINNDLAGKPRGAALAAPTGRAVAPIRVAKFKLGLQGGVGEGEPNPVGDVKRTKQALGALGLMPEDPFDDPPPFLDGTLNKALLEFQRENGLKPDALVRPGGPTEVAMNAAVTANLKRRAPEMAAYWKRTGDGGGRLLRDGVDTGSGGIQTVSFVPGRPDAIDDGNSSGQPTEGPEPAQGILLRRYGFPLPQLYIPSKDDLRRIRRDAERLRFKAPFVGLGWPTITFGPNPDDELAKKPTSLKGPDPDKERAKKVVPEGYPADGPKLPQLENLNAHESNGTLVFTPVDLGIEPPIILENSLGSKNTQKDNNNLLDLLKEAAIYILGEGNAKITNGGVDESGNRRIEKYYPNILSSKKGAAARKNSSRSDGTIKIVVNGETWYIEVQTYSRLKSGKPTKRERDSATRLAVNAGGRRIKFLAPKLLGKETWSDYRVRKMLLRVIDRIRYGLGDSTSPEFWKKGFVRISGKPTYKKPR